tara:strand:- start:12161 stop:12337 length:177 start_codon:yes stop_codon:yes gene_type:complete
MIRDYIGKNIFNCEMCKKQSKNMFLWEGLITKKTLYVCKKCTKRESGKKHMEKLMEKK